MVKGILLINLEKCIYGLILRLSHLQKRVPNISFHVLPILPIFGLKFNLFGIGQVVKVKITKYF